MSQDPLANDFFHASNHGQRDMAMPRFYTRPIKNEFKSEERGHPIFEDEEYVEILIPGNRGTTVDTLVKEEHRQRWPQAYAAFKSGQEVASEGTPIEEWAAITRSEAEELKYFHVRTVETLASLDDNALGKVRPMGGHALREKARRFLAQADGSAPLDALAAKNAEQATTIGVLEKQVAELTSRLDGLAASKGAASGDA